MQELYDDLKSALEAEDARAVATIGKQLISEMNASEDRPQGGPLSLPQSLSQIRGMSALVAQINSRL